MAEGFMRKAIVPLPMADLNLQLEVDNCPHCGTAKPTLALPMIYGQQGQGIVHSQDYTGKNRFMWLTYICSTCGKGVLAGAKTKPDNAQEHVGVFPAPRTVSEDVPDTARNYLLQAIRSLSAPDPQRSQERTQFCSWKVTHRARMVLWPIDRNSRYSVRSETTIPLFDRRNHSSVPTWVPQDMASAGGQ